MFKSSLLAITGSEVVNVATESMIEMPEETTHFLIAGITLLFNFITYMVKRKKEKKLNS
jgi:divalent metal cation (Fe/Co/Zn/Cd) transporter